MRWKKARWPEIVTDPRASSAAYAPAASLERARNTPDAEGDIGMVKAALEAYEATNGRLHPSCGLILLPTEEQLERQVGKSERAKRFLESILLRHELTHAIRFARLDDGREMTGSLSDVLRTFHEEMAANLASVRRLEQRWGGKGRTRRRVREAAWRMRVLAPYISWKSAIQVVRFWVVQDKTASLSVRLLYRAFG